MLWTLEPKPYPYHFLFGFRNIDAACSDFYFYAFLILSKYHMYSIRLISYIL